MEFVFNLKLFNYSLKNEEYINFCAFMELAEDLFKEIY